MNTNVSLVDVAYKVMSDRYLKDQNPVSFSDLLIEVGKELDIKEEEELMELASRFYTALTLDGRFVIKENNTWTLREHELFSNVHIDMNDVYSDDDDEEGDKEDIEQELGQESDEDVEDEMKIAEGDDNEDE